MTCICNNSVEAQKANTIKLDLLKGFPVTEKGISKGVSACFAGIINKHLVIAGGCNFPDVPAAEGGKKKYYQGIYAAPITHNDTLQWQLVGQLPAPCAYGVGVTVANELICMGGCNDKGATDKVFKIKLKDNKAVVEELPTLPWPLDNFAGSVHNDSIMVYDGLHIALLQLNDIEKGWNVLPALYSEKLGQPVCGYADNNFCVWGGCTAKTQEKDTKLQLHGYKITPHGAIQIEGPCTEKQEDVYLGGAAAVNCGDGGILTLGGVNKNVFEAAVNRPQPGYMHHPKEWYQFNLYVTLYNKGKWSIIGKHEAAARAGAVLVYDGTYIYIIGGELKPGVRTADIYRFSLPCK